MAFLQIHDEKINPELLPPRWAAVVALPNKEWCLNDCNLTAFHSTIVKVPQINQHLALEGADNRYSSKENTMLTWQPCWEVIVRLYVCVWEREGRDKSLGEGLSGTWRPQSQPRIPHTAKRWADYCFIILKQTHCAKHNLTIPWESTSQL